MKVNEARNLTARIRHAANDLWGLVVVAYRSRIWLVLGYPNWDIYCQKELGDLKIKLPKESRREVVLTLRDYGLSLRAIASVTGYDKHTVARDLGANAPVAQQTPMSPPLTSRRHITGCNGKQYPGRDPWKSLLRTSCTIAKMGARVVELAGDSDFGNQERIKEANLRDLCRARDALNQVIAKLEGVTA